MTHDRKEPDAPSSRWHTFRADAADRGRGGSPLLRISCGDHRVELRQLLKRGRTSLLIGVAFLSVCLLLSQLVARYIPQGGLLAIPREGLTIGGVGGLMATDGDLFVRLVAHPPPRSPLEPVALD